MERHTNILATRGCCINTVCAPFHAVIQGQPVEVSAENRASQLLDSFDGGLGGARWCYVYWHLEMFRALATLMFKQDERKGQSGARFPGA